MGSRRSTVSSLGHQSSWSTSLVRMRRTGRSHQSEVESRPHWGLHERTSSPSRSATLPRMTGKKSRAPAPPPPPPTNSSKVGRSVMATGMATFHHPRRKFHIPCKGRSVLAAEDDEVGPSFYLFGRQLFPHLKWTTQSKQAWLSRSIGQVFSLLFCFSKENSNFLSFHIVIRFLAVGQRQQSSSHDNLGFLFYCFDDCCAEFFWFKGRFIFDFFMKTGLPLAIAQCQNVRRG